jgi:DNA polymerase III subunit beta
MLIKLFRDDIIEGLQKSAAIIPAKTGAAFLRTIWLRAEAGGLRIMSTDSNLEFMGLYPADIQQEGLVGVAGRNFYDLIRKLPPGQIVLRAEEDSQHLAIEQAGRRYKLPVNEKSWFQDFAEFPEENTVFWSGDFLGDLIDKIAYCLGEEDAEAISCLYLGRSRDGQGLETCGLNGHQFAMYRFLHDDLRALVPENGLLIQRRYLAELKKWLAADEIELNLGGKRLFLRTGDKKETFSLPLSVFQYPDYTTFLGKVVNEATATLAVNRVEMIDALERIAIFNTEADRCAYFDLKPGDLMLSSQGQDVGKASEPLEVEYDGAIARIAFPTKHLIEILSRFASDQVRFKMTSPEGPCGVEGTEDPDYMVIIMPMKITEETYYNEESEAI